MCFNAKGAMVSKSFDIFYEVNLWKRGGGGCMKKHGGLSPSFYWTYLRAATKSLDMWPWALHLFTQRPFQKI